MTNDQQGRSGRRGFLREAAARVIGPVAESLRQRFDTSPNRPYLRPPGAIEEKTFLATCYRCGSCVNACPAEAIFLLDRDASDAAGSPIIDPDRAPCVVCADLPCANACVSRALVPVSDVRLIRMGRADVYGPMCVRSRGEECTLCVDRCPLGEAAVHLADQGPPQVSPAGCVGCGVCQHHCPTTPKAIVVTPR